MPPPTVRVADYPAGTGVSPATGHRLTIPELCASGIGVSHSSHRDAVQIAVHRRLYVSVNRRIQSG